MAGVGAVKTLKTAPVRDVAHLVPWQRNKAINYAAQHSTPKREMLPMEAANILGFFKA